MCKIFTTFANRYIYIKNMNMETSVLNTAQKNILRILSFVKDEKTVSDIETVLTNYFADKVDKGFDELINNGSISVDTIEKWEKEHMRTPY